jgi:hypothetical protein
LAMPETMRLLVFIFTFIDQLVPYDNSRHPI